jgi:meiotic recombination protein DMC1
MMCGLPLPQLLNKHLSQLIKLAENLKIAVVVVNQVSADPGASAMFGPVMKPIGGHILAHASTTRLFFKKVRAPSGQLGSWAR